MILVIDNYDSFVHNLARYIRRLGCETVVVRNDETSANVIESLAPKAIVISPGPCTPDQAGCSVDVIQKLGPTIPILGICLGHQAIAQAFGGNVIVANEPVHGRQSLVKHNQSRMFKDVPETFTAARYHSLVASISELPKELLVTAQTNDGIIMAIEHQDRPLIGLQFHPESILTQCGYQLLKNFLSIANIEVPQSEFINKELSGNWDELNWISSKVTTSDRLSIQELP